MQKHGKDEIETQSTQEGRQNSEENSVHFNVERLVQKGKKYIRDGRLVLGHTSYV